MIGFFASLLIARIATPNDFGVFAIAAAIVLVANIFAEAGLSSTIIYDKDFCENKASTILWISVLLSIIILLFLTLSSGKIASYFNEPRLQIIMPFMAINCVSTSVGITHAALIARKLQFKKKAMMALGSNVIAVMLGLFIAFSGWPLAGLTTMFVLTPILLTISMWIGAPWPVKFLCKPKLLYNDIAYSGNIALSLLLEQLFKSGFTFFIGFRFDVATVGYLSRAEAIKNLASQTLDKVVQRVAFPLLSKARLSDAQNMMTSHLMISNGILCGLVPLLWFTHRFADDIVLILLGPNWAITADLLKILIFSGVVIPLTSLNLSLLKSNGRAVAVMFNKAIAAIALVIFAFYGPAVAIEELLLLLISVFVFQLFASLIALSELPNFHILKYVKSLIITGFSLIFGIYCYEMLASFHFDFTLLNLFMHGTCLCLTSVIVFFMTRKMSINAFLSS